MVQNDDGKRVTIRRTYRLNSPAASDDDAALAIQGNGTFVFNRQLGVPESLDMKHSLTVTSNNSSVSIPVTVAWSRISDDEYQAHLKARQEQYAALKERTAQRKAGGGSGAKPMDPARKRDTIADLRSGKMSKISSRLGQLGGLKLHSDDADLALAVRELQNHANPGVSMQAKRLWKKWSAILEGSGNAKMAKSPATAPGKNARQMRTWSDNTGSFQIEAVFVKVDGDNVVLKKKDGKELNVPVSRLSENDQAVIAELSKASGPSNPFE